MGQVTLGGAYKSTGGAGGLGGSLVVGRGGYKYFLSGYVLFNPIDPNPAISAHVVFPQSGHIRPEKQPFFQNFPYFSKLGPTKTYLPPIGFQYIKLKAMECRFTYERDHIGLMNSFSLNLSTCSKFGGNFVVNLGKHGEVLHTGYNSMGSKGLNGT